MKYEQAIHAAELMIDWFRPACLGHNSLDGETISIAGSLRRHSKTDYDEIDLIMLPDLSPLPLPCPEFGKPIPKIYKSKIDKLLAESQESAKIIRKNGGDRSVKFFSPEHGINFDLYIVRPPATWGVQLVIRTGPRDFSNYIVSQRHQRGALPNGYRVQCGAVWEGETKTAETELLGKIPIGFESEEGFLDWLGLGWIEPEDRVARWGKS